MLLQPCWRRATKEFSAAHRIRNLATNSSYSFFTLHTIFTAGPSTSGFAEKETPFVMLKKRLLGFVFSGLLTYGAFGQEAVVRIAPPHRVAEARTPMPS